MPSCILPVGTQAEMAKKLELSLSGYKKMISGETTKIDTYTAFLMYDLYGKWLFEMIRMTSPLV